MSLLEAHDLHAGYGKMEILRGVTLKVEPGQILSIIGPNGAGKSTVFKAIFGLLQVRQGRVIFGGDDVTNSRPNSFSAGGWPSFRKGGTCFPS